MQKFRQFAHVGIKEIEIFEDEQNKAGRDDADDQESFSLGALGLLD